MDGRSLQRIAILVFLALVGVTTAAGDTVCRVIDDGGAAISGARVFDGTQAVGTPLLTADSRGSLLLTKDLCQRISGFRVFPPNDEHYPSRVYQCSDLVDHATYTIKLWKKEYIENLRHNATYFEEKNEYATASLIYNEIYQRMRGIDESSAEEARRKTINLFARFLGNDEPFATDPMQEKPVISRSLKSDIERFQRENSIPDHGRIDMQTLRLAAGCSIGKFIFTRVGN